MLATVVEGAEATPGRAGFKMLIFADGHTVGTVGGGALELRVRETAVELFSHRESCLLSYRLVPEDIGMLCGGEAKVFLEYYPPLRRAYLFGAGHLCRALAPLLKTIEFSVVAIDDRPDAATRENIPAADEFFAGSYLQFIEQFQPTPEDAILIFTHGHAHDFEILRELCARNVEVRYLGMIGSARKVGECMQRIREMNFPGRLVDRVWSPVGLNVAKTTPAEIAISIAAEMLAIYHEVETIDHWKTIKQMQREEK